MIYENSDTVKRKTPKQREYLKKLKLRLKVANKKEKIIRKKREKFEIENKQILDEYFKLEQKHEQKCRISNNIDDRIIEYNDKFIIRRLECDE